MRLELNERIEDESGIVTLEVFRKMFFGYFKGEQTAFQIYDMILPIISVHYDSKSKKFLEGDDKRATPDKKCIKI